MARIHRRTAPSRHYASDPRSSDHAHTVADTRGHANVRGRADAHTVADTRGHANVRGRADAHTANRGYGNRRGRNATPNGHPTRTGRAAPCTWDSACTAHPLPGSRTRVGRDHPLAVPSAPGSALSARDLTTCLTCSKLNHNSVFARNAYLPIGSAATRFPLANTQRSSKHDQITD
jgi:hypothetical protein